MSQFVHLHVHTEYSLLDGAARLGDLFDEVKRQGMPALAITDHGQLHGAYDFFTRATKAGVKPIIGIEAYVAPGHRTDKERIRWGTPEQKRYDVGGSGAYTHMTIWAKNKTGLHNLFRLSSRAYSEGLLGKYPRMDAELLAEHAEGLMASTGCPGGAVMTRLNLGQHTEALEVAAQYRDIFGPENYFLELMDHGLDIEHRVRAELLAVGRRLGLKPLVTNDSHYTRVEEAGAHDALLCVQTGATLNQADRFRFEGSGYYIKTAAEMYGVDSSDYWQEGCRNTLLVADMVDPAGMFEFRNLMPRFPVPAGHTEQSWFRAEVMRGMEWRFPDGYDDRHRAQVEYEIEMIIQMGFPAYFLVVADFVAWAKRTGIRVGPGRGSAAGSLVAYALGITELDPLEHGLIFERFLNPERVTMPDIDVDFDDRRRGEVIRYVTERYGSDRVAQIVTYGRIKARAAIKDAARVLAKPFSVGDKISKAYPPDIMGSSMPLDGILDPGHPRYEEAAEVRSMYETDDEVREVVDTARGLEGLVRQTGVHAAGVIMSSEPLVDHIPVMVRPDDGAVLTQFDYPTCEALGLLKMDFLGLRNLTIIDDAIRNIRANRGVTVLLEELPLDDKPTYELLARGDTLGVFQLDGGPMRALLRSMAPDNFEDISAVLALYRPGPMGANAHNEYADRKNNRKPVVPIHPELAEPLADILGGTYGLIVYQEQVMAITQKLAGYSLGRADLLRRAMGKKKKEILDKEFIPFRDGCRANGYSDEAIQAVWDVLVPFAGYAFNKAHSAAYGLVAYWTAYLKAHYPAEYMAAVLTSVGDDKNKMATYLTEARRMGLRVLPPDVNVSNSSFTPNGDREVRFGLTAVKNVGEGVVQEVIRVREEAGRFTSLPDFLLKMQGSTVSKRAIESLVKAGAFDTTGATRRGLAELHELLVDSVDKLGTPGLFVPAGAAPIRLEVGQDWSKQPRLTAEREMLGLYVSDHPLAGLDRALRAQSTHSVAEVRADTAPEGLEATIAGLVASVQVKTNKRGEHWAVVELEDQTGAIDVAFFPATYRGLIDVLVRDAIVLVTGRLEYRDGTPQLIGVGAELASGLDAAQDDLVVVTMPVVALTEGTATVLADILGRHPGDTEVHLVLEGAGGPRAMRVGKYRVARNRALLTELSQFSAALKGCV